MKEDELKDIPTGNGRRIEVVEMEVGQLKEFDGNPRKIRAKKKKELKDSLEMFGDFGIIIIDEKNRIISGHQRVATLVSMHGEQHKVLCKRLVGYSESELKAINIKCNTHAGEWDMEKLAAWQADLHVDLGLDLPDMDAENNKIKGMELVRYEKYDYVMIVCKNEIDYNNLTRMLEIDDKKIVVSRTQRNERKIKCRAIWYHKMPCNLVKKKDEKLEK